MVLSASISTQLLQFPPPELLLKSTTTALIPSLPYTGPLIPIEGGYFTNTFSCILCPSSYSVLRLHCLRPDSKLYGVSFKILKLTWCLEKMFNLTKRMKKNVPVSYFLQMLKIETSTFCLASDIRAILALF